MPSGLIITNQEMRYVLPDTLHGLHMRSIILTSNGRTSRLGQTDCPTFEKMKLSMKKNDAVQVHVDHICLLFIIVYYLQNNHRLQAHLRLQSHTHRHTHSHTLTHK